MSVVCILRALIGRSNLSSTVFIPHEIVNDARIQIEKQ
jgi:hypothetical protein